MSTNLRDRYWFQLHQLSSVQSIVLFLVVFLLTLSSKCYCIKATSSIVLDSESSETVTFANNNQTTSSVNVFEASDSAETISSTTELLPNGRKTTFYDTQEDNNGGDTASNNNTINLSCTEPKVLPNTKEICLIEHVCSTCEFDVDTNVTILSHESSIITFININDVPLKYISTMAIFQQYINLEILQLENCLISELSGIINATKLKKLYLNHNLLRELDEGQLDGAPNLRLFEVTWNKIENLHEKAFFNNEKLYWLDFSHNRIGGLPWDVFQNLKAVVTINLSHNMIDELGLVFNGMESLSTLDLSHNFIQKIRDRTFDRTTNLEEIHLSYNHITVLEHNAFDQCSKLKSLDLSNNRLQSIHFDIPSSQLGTILLYNNSIAELACTTRLQNLTNLKLHAQNNQISTMFIQEGIPVTDCSLDNNRLKSVGTLTKIYSLTSLRIAHNDLSESEDFASFLNLQNLVELDLSDTNIQKEVFSHLFHLPNLIFWLDLSHNPAVAEFEWGQITESPLTILRLNNCSLTTLNVQNLLITANQLHELEIFDNKFKCSELKKILVDLAVGGIDVKRKDDVSIDSIEGINCENDTEIMENEKTEGFNLNTDEGTDRSENITKLVLQPKVTQIKPVSAESFTTQDPEPTKSSENIGFESTAYESPTRPRIQIRPHIPSSSTTSIVSSTEITPSMESPSNTTTDMPAIENKTLNPMSTGTTKDNSSFF